MNKLGYILSAIAILCSCSKNENSSQYACKIDFRSQVDTRGAATTDDNIATMGVSAYFTDLSDFADLDFLPNIMYNRNVYKSGSEWTYTPEAYWPVNENSKISFFAYSPHDSQSEGSITLSAETVTGIPYLTYVIDQQKDLLVAKPKLNQKRANGAIGFSFDHALTQLSFSVKNGDPTYDIKLDAVKLKAAYITADFSLSDKTISNLKDLSIITLHKSELIINVDDAIKLPGGDLYVIPQSLSDIYLEVSCRVNDVPSTKTVSFAALTTWKQGVSIDYTITLNPVAIISEDTEWEEDGEDGELGSNKKPISINSVVVAWKKRVIYDDIGRPGYYVEITPYNGAWDEENEGGDLGSPVRPTMIALYLTPWKTKSISEDIGRPTYPSEGTPGDGDWTDKEIEGEL